ncbi:integrator complex subunit 6 homolog [Oppia nitens]|uniref:integrator complex subunit 6 homolog n=1 Tax=Oppia nitens TaxID=1686743 RepID=UPI0023DCAA4B|nr:integrator complex subunit 6 homolog [Oppia nitens]
MDELMVCRIGLLCSMTLSAHSLSVKNMVSSRISKYLLYLMWFLTVNLIYNFSVFDCQTNPKRSQTSGITTRNANKDNKIKTTEKPVKVPKPIETETQKAIDDIINSNLELTTILTINYRQLSENNDSLDETFNIEEKNLTSNESLLMINDIDLNITTTITTPILDNNITTNNSIDVQTIDYMNVTQNDLNVTNIITTTLTPIATNFSQLIDNEDLKTTTISEVTQHLNESPFVSSTIAAIDSITESSVDLDNNSQEELTQCVFENHIHCKSNIELQCFGFGEIDCRSQSRTRRAVPIGNRTVDDNFDTKVFKSHLEKHTQSATIDNSRCILTPEENSYFLCNPMPTLNQCNGRSICRPRDTIREPGSEPLPAWKVALIATLTTIGVICFIAVAIIAYVSYNKLKVRPEMSANGYHNNNNNNNNNHNNTNTQNTRV